MSEEAFREAISASPEPAAPARALERPLLAPRARGKGRASVWPRPWPARYTAGGRDAGGEHGSDLSAGRPRPRLADRAARRREVPRSPVPPLAARPTLHPAPQAGLRPPRRRGPRAPHLPAQPPAPRRPLLPPA